MPKVSVGLHELPTIPHFLYRFYDRTDTLLYIGITNDPKTRFKWHRKNQPWWSDVDQSKTRIEYHATRDSVLKAERAAIEDETPLYNDQHNPSVDTPASIMAEEAKADLADSILRRLAGDEDAYKEILQEATEQIEAAEGDEDETYWQPFSTNPKIYGAAIGAERASSERWHYREALSLLLEALPITLVEACRAKAEQHLNDEDCPPSECEIAYGTVSLLVEELGDEYLDGLDPEEARGWRACGAAMLHPNADRKYRVQHAAAYARAAKAGRGYEQAWQLCIANESHRARCANQVEELTFFSGCAVCGAVSCLGHSFWCAKHIEKAREGRFSWSKDDKTIVVSHTSPWGAISEEPPF